MILKLTLPLILAISCKSALKTHLSTVDQPNGENNPTSPTNDSPGETSTINPDDPSTWDNANFLGLVAELPACTAATYGRAYYVFESNSFHICGPNATYVVKAAGSESVANASNLYRVSDSSLYGNLLNYGVTSWAITPELMFTPLSGSSTFSPVRQNIYFTSAGCTGDTYLPTNTPYPPFASAAEANRAIYYVSGSDTPYYRSSLVSEAIYPASVRRVGEGCTDLEEWDSFYDLKIGHNDNVAQLTVFNGKLFFGGSTFATGNELMTTDGTEAGTQAILDAAYGSADHIGSGFSIGIALGKLFFIPSNSATAPIYTTDGTLAGTASLGTIGSSSVYVGSAGTMAYFSTINAGNKLYSTDLATPGGFTLIDSGQTSHLSGFALDSNFIYQVRRGNYVYELMSTDGTNTTLLLTGTTSLMEIKGKALSSTVGLMGLHATADGHELWRTDGTAVGTYLLKDIAPGAASSSPNSFVLMGGTMYFLADDGTNGQRLWKSDGTGAGTVMINTGSMTGSHSSLVAFGGKLYFIRSGYQLWESDGTDAGTKLVKNFGFDTNSARVVSAFADHLFIDANYIDGKKHYFVSDGTTSGTYAIVKDAAATINSIAFFEGKYYFSAARNATETQELFVYTPATVANNRQTSQPTSYYPARALDGYKLMSNTETLKR